MTLRREEAYKKRYDKNRIRTCAGRAHSLTAVLGVELKIRGEPVNHSGTLPCVEESNKRI